jgi:serine protease Do
MKNAFNLVITIIISSVISVLIGFSAGKYWIESNQITDTTNQIVHIKEDSAVIDVVKMASPAVVSIIITKDLPLVEKYYYSPFGKGIGIPMYRRRGKQRQEVGGGTGFIVTKDGFVVTNKHVVRDPKADYTVLMNDDRRFTAKVLARDIVNDVAILKIEGSNFPTLTLGDSDDIQVGQSVIAIGNALSEFRNTVSKGIISGLARLIAAGSGGAESEYLFGLIQTDTPINPGNSGGPLLNLAGQVVGINTAIVQNAQNIGFSIPINSVKNAIHSVKKHGRIIRPWIGIRYFMLNEAVAKANNIKVNHGALIIGGQNQMAVSLGSPAAKVGLKQGDIILEINDKKLTVENPLVYVVSSYQPGEEIRLKVFRDDKVVLIKLVLAEMK